MSISENELFRLAQHVPFDPETTGAGVDYIRRVVRNVRANLDLLQSLGVVHDSAARQTAVTRAAVVALPAQDRARYAAVTDLGIAHHDLEVYDEEQEGPLSVDRVVTVALRTFGERLGEVLMDEAYTGKLRPAVPRTIWS